ncbi:hypothetical protein [Helcococcus bovis]|uniref:hypothetical protein n=1 Tax=Helcococcus bovis TaxID=3153252 RepID=UPI0038BB4450
MTEKEKKVYEILLTPIICDNNVKKISMQDKIIYSPQLYNSNLDEAPVVDGNIATARNPGDLNTYVKAFLELL